MPEEKFQIRIRPDGTIVFQGREMDAAETRQLREIIEDALGEIREVQRTQSDGDTPRGVKLADSDRKRREIRRGD